MQYELRKINYDLSCNKRCRFCYQFFDCINPEKEDRFIKHSHYKQIARAMGGIKHKIAVMAGKGGVGKTTVTTTLALQLRLNGHSVGILDLDLAGASVNNFLNLQQVKLRLGKNGIIPACGPYGLKVVSNSFFLDEEDTITDFDQEKQEIIEGFLGQVDYGNLDYLLIDMPPGTGVETVNVLKLIPSIDGIIIVTIPSTVSQDVVTRTINLCLKSKVEILGIVENMTSFTCPKCDQKTYSLSSGGAAKMSEDYGLNILARIPSDHQISLGVSTENNFFLKNASVASLAYRALAAFLEGITPVASNESSTRQHQPDSTIDNNHDKNPQVLKLNHGFNCNYMCHDCSRYLKCNNPLVRNKQKRGQLARQLDKSMAGIKHKIAVISGKGGVGKSTIAANLAVSLSREGKKTAILDSDFHGPSIPRILGVLGSSLRIVENKIEPVVSPWGPSVISMSFLTERNEAITWYQDLKRSALEQFLGDVNYGDLDYLVVDLPAGTGSETVNLLRLIPDLDGALVVTTPSFLSQSIVLKVVKLLQAVGIPILGIVENMSKALCSQCGDQFQLFASHENNLALSEKLPVLITLPMDGEVAGCCDSGTPVACNDSYLGVTFVSLAQSIIMICDL